MHEGHLSKASREAGLKCCGGAAGEGPHQAPLPQLAHSHGPADGWNGRSRVQLAEAAEAEEAHGSEAMQHSTPSNQPEAATAESWSALA